MLLPPLAVLSPTAKPTTGDCYPLTDGGNCHGVAGDGERIACRDHDGWRWEPA